MAKKKINANVIAAYLLIFFGALFMFAAYSYLSPNENPIYKNVISQNQITGAVIYNQTYDVPYPDRTPNTARDKLLGFYMFESPQLSYMQRIYSTTPVNTNTRLGIKRFPWEIGNSNSNSGIIQGGKLLTFDSRVLSPEGNNGSLDFDKSPGFKLKYFNGYGNVPAGEVTSHIVLGTAISFWIKPTEVNRTQYILQTLPYRNNAYLMGERDANNRVYATHVGKIMPFGLLIDSDGTLLYKDTGLTRMAGRIESTEKGKTILQPNKWYHISIMSVPGNGNVGSSYIGPRISYYVNGIKDIKDWHQGWDPGGMDNGVGFSFNNNNVLKFGEAGTRIEYPNPNLVVEAAKKYYGIDVLSPGIYLNDVDAQTRFTGLMDEFAIYEGLSDNDIQQVYNERKQFFTSAAPAVSITSVPAVFAAPSSILANAISNSQINLNWSSVLGASSYKIYRSTTSGTEAYIANSNVNSYSDSALTSGTAYYYKVSAVNSSGFESALSNEVGITLQTGQTANLDNAAPAIVLSSPDVSDPIIDKNGSIQFNLACTDDNIISYSWKVKGLPVSNSGSYNFSAKSRAIGEYTVQGYCTDSQGADSSVLYTVTIVNYSVQAQQLTPNNLPAPSSLNAEAISSSKVLLTWTDNSNTEDSFEVNYFTAYDFTNVTTINIPANIESYTITGLNPDTEYYFEVVAITSDLPSPSEIVSAATLEDSSVQQNNSNPYTPGAYCGDGVCTSSSGESCAYCPIDCGTCPAENTSNNNNQENKNNNTLWIIILLIAIILCLVVFMIVNKIKNKKDSVPARNNPFPPARPAPAPSPSPYAMQNQQRNQQRFQPRR